MTLEEAMMSIRAIHVDRDIPFDLKPFACYVPDGGYSIMAIPQCLLPNVDKNDPLMHAVPIPEKFVLEKGYTFQNGLPVVDAEYDRFLGLVVEEKYETWR